VLHLFKSKIMTKLIGASLAIATFFCSGAYAQSYRVLRTIPASRMGGGWDYIAVCPVNDNIYVSHATQVNIINKNTGDSVGVIPNTTGVHGIAFAPEHGKGFTTNGRLNTVSVFDLTTNAVTAEIKTGENPDAIMYDAHSHRIYVCDGHSQDLTVIDPANNKVVKTVALGGKPETAVSDDAGHLYINIEDKSEIVMMDTRSYEITHRWKTGKGEEPSGLAIDKKTKRLFAGCGNNVLVVMDAENGKVIKELPIGDGCDGVAFDPELKNVFSSNGEGTLTVIHESTANDFEVAQNVATKKSARTIALDEKTHLVYLPAAEMMPPAPGENGRRRGIVPGSFCVLVVGK